ncbi:hypothetical protein GGR58DRAFT_439541 [Xylaria digitata]|nr:hypothetical protein GGR58DRAFT_439541 [Xylaria digitata]
MRSWYCVCFFFFFFSLSLYVCAFPPLFNSLFSRLCTNVDVENRWRRHATHYFISLSLFPFYSMLICNLLQNSRRLSPHPFPDDPSRTTRASGVSGLPRSDHSAIG